MPTIKIGIYTILSQGRTFNQPGVMLYVKMKLGKRNYILGRCLGWKNWTIFQLSRNQCNTNGLIVEFTPETTVKDMMVASLLWMPSS